MMNKKELGMIKIQIENAMINGGYEQKDQGREALRALIGEVERLRLINQELMSQVTHLQIDVDELETEKRRLERELGY
jgi:hypothetical protein